MNESPEELRVQAALGLLALYDVSVCDIDDKHDSPRDWIGGQVRVYAKSPSHAIEIVKERHGDILKTLAAFSAKYGVMY